MRSIAMCLPKVGESVRGTSGNLRYWQRSLALKPDKLLYLLPLWETAGPVAQDLGPHKLPVAYAAGGITYAQPGIGDGTAVLLLDSYISLYSPELAALFDPSEFYVDTWLRIPNLATWTDGSTRTALHIGMDTSNNIQITKRSTGPGLTASFYWDSDVKFNRMFLMGTEDYWMHVGAKVNKAADRVAFYLNGMRYLAPQSGVSTSAWANPIAETTTGIGSRSSASVAIPWRGCLAHTGAWLAELTDWEILQRANPTGATPVCIFPVGDSKTNGAGAGINALVMALRQSTGRFWAAYPARIGVDGITTAQMAARVDADIAAISAADLGRIVEIPINLGANDTGVTDAPTQAAWKANMAYIITAYHAACPTAKIRIAKPWKRNFAVQMALINAAIDDLYITYPWLEPGIDEALILEGGDDGVTWTSDGIHPEDPAGYVREWTEPGISWKTVMGY